MKYQKKMDMSQIVYFYNREAYYKNLYKMKRKH